MKTLRFRPALVAGAFALVFGAVTARADFVNGDFESTTPVAPAGGYVLFPAGSGSVTGWTIGTVGTPNDVLVHNATYQEAENGVTFNTHSGTGQALDITGNGNTGFYPLGVNTISQTISTVVGQVYALTFWLGHAASNNGSPLYVPSDAAAVYVTVDGNAPVLFSNSAVTSGFVNWAEQAMVFTATSTSTTITFASNTPNNPQFQTHPNYAGLDDLHVTAVPEPGPLTLCAAGLPLFLGLSWFRSRRSSR